MSVAESHLPQSLLGPPLCPRSSEALQPKLSREQFPRELNIAVPDINEMMVRLNESTRRRASKQAMPEEVGPQPPCHNGGAPYLHPYLAQRQLRSRLPQPSQQLISQALREVRQQEEQQQQQQQVPEKPLPTGTERSPWPPAPRQQLAAPAVVVGRQSPPGLPRGRQVQERDSCRASTYLAEQSILGVSRSSATLFDECSEPQSTFLRKHSRNQAFDKSQASRLSSAAGANLSLAGAANSSTVPSDSASHAAFTADAEEAEPLSQPPNQVGSPAMTTLMIRNIPTDYWQDQLVEEWAVWKGTYDFLYLPRNCSGSSNLGYLFINFLSENHAQCFKAAWQKAWLQHSGPRHLNISFADVQGLEENVIQLKNKRLRRIRRRQCRPIIIVTGVQISLEQAMAGVISGSWNPSAAVAAPKD